MTFFARAGWWGPRGGMLDFGFWISDCGEARIDSESSDASAIEPTPTAQFLKKCRRVSCCRRSMSASLPRDRLVEIQQRPRDQRPRRELSFRRAVWRRIGRKLCCLRTVHREVLAQLGE